MVTSYEDTSAFVPLDPVSPAVDRLVSVTHRAEPKRAERSKLDTLREMGWSLEARDCYWLARHGHRRIELFRDGRVIFKDPTITARYQLDDEWLKVICFVWPNVQF